MTNEAVVVAEACDGAVVGAEVVGAVGVGNVGADAVAAAAAGGASVGAVSGGLVDTAAGAAFGFCCYEERIEKFINLFF